MWLSTLTFCLTGSFLLGCKTRGYSFPKQEVLPVYKEIKQEVLPVYKEIKEGTEKLTDVVIKVSGETFRSNIQTSKGEKEAVRDLRTDVGEMHKHFETAHTQMDKIKKSKENKHMESKNKLAIVERKVLLVQNEISQATSSLKNNEKQLRDSESYYKKAEDEHMKAQRKMIFENVRYQAAKREEEHWRTVCMATGWIPFVNWGTCLKHKAEKGDYKNAVHRLKQRSTNLETNRKLKEEAQARTKQQKKMLNEKQFKMSNLIEKRKSLQNKIKYLELDNKFYANSVMDLQILNTEIDLIFSRSKGTFDYTHFGTSVEAFIERLENLENQLKANKDLLRVDKETLAAISKSLSETKEAVKILKERKLSYYPITIPNSNIF